MKLLKLLLSAFLIASLCILPCEAKTPWTSKPPLGSQINWGHPLSRGLVGCWLMNEGGGAKLNNLALSQYPMTIYSDTPWKPSKKGVSVNFDGSGNDYAGLGLLPGLAQQRPFSVVWASIDNAAEFKGLIHIMGPAAGGGGNWFNVYYNNTTNGIGCSRFSNMGAKPLVAIVQTQWHDFACTTTGIGGADPIILYIDGSLNSQSLGTYYSAVGENNIEIGRGIAGYYSKSQFAYVYIYTRVLSPSEIQQLYVEPYCFIKPQTDWDMIKAAVAGAAAGFMKIGKFWGD